MPRSQITRDDRVAPGRIRVHDFAGRVPVLNHGARRQTIADFCADESLSERCAITAEHVAGAEFRRRNGEPRDRPSAVDHGELLVSDTHDDFRARLRARRERQHAGHQQSGDRPRVRATSSICASSAMSGTRNPAKLVENAIQFASDGRMTTEVAYINASTVTFP